MAGGNASAVTFKLRKAELEANDEYRSWLVMSLCRNQQAGKQTDRQTEDRLTD